MLSCLRQEKGFYPRMVRLALPIILQNLITESLALADTFMVGLLGEAPLAGVALANIPLFVIQLMIFGFQSGSSVLISQFHGKGDQDAVNEVLGIGIYVAGGATLLFGCVLWFFPVQFMGLFGDDPGVVALAARYGRVVAFSVFFRGLSAVYIAAHRSMGNARVGLWILGVSMGTNVILNYGLIFGRLGLPELGIEGAALATLIARMLQLALSVGHGLLGRRFRLRPAKLFRPGGEMWRRFFRVASPVVLNETLWGLGTSLYPTIMGHMAGSQEILAAYAVAGNIERVCTVGVFAVSATTAILVGQSVGSGERERARRLGVTMDAVAVILGVAVGLAALGLVCGVLAPWLYPHFKLSAAAGEIATMMLAVTFLFLPFQSFNTTNIVGVLRGGGDVGAATVIDLALLWAVAIPLSALVGLVLEWGIFWVYMVRAVEQGLKVVLGVIRLRSGKWVRDLTRPDG